MQPLKTLKPFELIWPLREKGVTNGKIRALPRRRDPSLKIRARALNLFVKSEPES